MAIHCWICKTELTAENSYTRNSGRNMAGICKDCDRDRCFVDRWRKKSSAERKAKIKRLEKMLELLNQIELEK